jgi:hypothetical protein
MSPLRKPRPTSAKGTTARTVFAKTAAMSRELMTAGRSEGDNGLFYQAVDSSVSGGATEVSPRNRAISPMRAARARSLRAGPKFCAPAPQPTGLSSFKDLTQLPIATAPSQPSPPPSPPPPASAHRGPTTPSATTPSPVRHPAVPGMGWGCGRGQGNASHPDRAQDLRPDAAHRVGPDHGHHRQGTDQESSHLRDNGSCHGSPCHAEWMKPSLNAGREQPFRGRRRAPPNGRRIPLPSSIGHVEKARLRPRTECIRP